MSYFTKTFRGKSICRFYLSKVFPILIILFISIVDTKAQVPIKLWDKTAGGEAQDILWSLIQTSDRGFMLGGSSDSDSSAEKSGMHMGGQDFWILKLDSLGNKIWDKTIGTFSYDAFRSIVQTEDGGYICGGPSDIGISGDKSEDVKGVDDYWVIKLDESGNKLWDKTIGGSGSDRLSSIVETPDGGCLLGGTSFSDSSGDKSENTKGENDYWIVKLDSIGNIQWDKTYGGSSSEELLTMVRSLNGGYLIGGYSRSDSSGDKSENTKGDADFWILKIDSEGNKLWDKSFGGNSEEILQTISITSNGNYLLGGSSYSDISGDKSEMSRGGSDYWVVQLDSSGNKLWDRTFGTSDREGCRSIIEISNGSYILGGSSGADIEGDKSQVSEGRSDFWIINLSTSGDKIWDGTYGASSGEGLRTVLQSSDLTLVIGGTSDSDANGDKSENSRGEFDYWLLKLNLFSPGIDSTAPIISILADTIFANNDPGFCSASVYWIEPEVTDEDGVAFIQSDYSPGDTFPVGTTTVTYTAQDSSGNTAMASFVIVVSDNEYPLVMTRNITVYLNDSGYVYIAEMDIENGSSDPCGIAAYQLSNYQFNYSSQGQDTVVLTVTDIHGNENSASATVTVLDTLVPAWLTAAGSLDRTLICGKVDELAEAQGLSPEAGDNCGSVTYIKTAGNLMGSTYANTWVAQDAWGNVSEVFTQLITITPVSIDASASSNPVPVGSAALLSATVIPAEEGIEVHFYIDEVLVGSEVTGLSGIAEWTVNNLLVGVYKIKTVAGDGCAESIAYLPVYDPDGGFVTGGGWIQSPAGAYYADSSLTGKANFGFVSKYKIGSNEVDGNTEFRFQAGNLNFKSSSHTAASLVIAGAKAIYKGIGTVNGAGNFGFMVSAIDGQVNGGGNADKFRIKIWDKNNGNGVMYDNQSGADENTDATTLLGGGSIVIHKPKNGQNLGYSPQGTSLKINAGHSIRLEAYPNPMQNRLNLRIDNPENHPVKIDLIHITGRLMPFKVRQVSNQLYQLEVTDLPVGVYSLQVQAGHTVQFVKVLKQE